MIGESGKLYLAAILDLFSRFIVGWAVSAVNDRHLTLKALGMAVKRRCPEAGLLHHSHQGCTYASEDYQRLLDTRGGDPFSAFHGVALVGLARAHAFVGDGGASRAAYERFFVNWATADPDVPILQQARTECGQLPPGKASEEI